MHKAKLLVNSIHSACTNSCCTI